jgi:transcriptional regulator with XRE-family HTH domain
MDQNTFGARLLALLQEQRLTQKQLSLKVGITEAAMSHYIKGDRIPRSSVLAGIAAALGTTSDYLMEGNPDQSISDFARVRRLIARNTKQMSMAEKKELIDLLLSDEQWGEAKR